MSSTSLVYLLAVHPVDRTQYVTGALVQAIVLNVAEFRVWLAGRHYTHTPQCMFCQLYTHYHIAELVSVAKSSTLASQTATSNVGIQWRLQDLQTRGQWDWGGHLWHLVRVICLISLTAVLYGTANR